MHPGKGLPLLDPSYGAMTGCRLPLGGNNIVGGSSLQPGQFPASTFGSWENECFHPKGWHLSGFLGLECGSTVLRSQAPSILFICCPQVLYSHKGLPPTFQGKRKNGTCFSSFCLLSNPFPLGHDSWVTHIIPLTCHWLKHSQRNTPCYERDWVIISFFTQLHQGIIDKIISIWSIEHEYLVYMYNVKWLHWWS